MRYIVVLGLLLQSIGLLYLSGRAVAATLEAEQYQKGYEAMRGHAEALERTIGRHVDVAYTCKATTQ